MLHQQMLWPPCSSIQGVFVPYCCAPFTSHRSSSGQVLTTGTMCTSTHMTPGISSTHSSRYAQSYTAHPVPAQHVPSCSTPSPHPGGGLAVSIKRTGHPAHQHQQTRRHSGVAVQGHATLPAYHSHHVCTGAPSDAHTLLASLTGRHTCLVLGCLGPAGTPRPQAAGCLHCVWDAILCRTR
jgi:hypothetical protein